MLTIGRPASVSALTCGCTLLLSGSLSDVLGSRLMFLTGCALNVAFTLGCGLAQTGLQLILFRAFCGISMSLALPAATSIITSTFPTGKARNIAFACLGATQPVGFSIGLVLGGVLIQSVGWRVGYYICAAVNLLLTLETFFGVPKDAPNAEPITWRRLVFAVDWVGASLASTSLGLLSYVFAIVTSGVDHLKSPANITLIVVAVLLVPAFVYWINLQERRGRVAIIPPSLFKSTEIQPHRARIFASTCLSVFIIYGAFDAYQYFATLYFQEIQHLSPLQTSPRYLPMVVCGCLMNILTGTLVHRISANRLVLVTAILSSGASLLMALAQPQWTYWSAVFVSMALAPLAADTLFTVANLIITEIFPKQIHGLAGGVFNTIAQIGNSVGLAITAVIASEVTKAKESGGIEEVKATLEGYRASFWTGLGAGVVGIVIAGWGLRGSGKVGVKRD